MNNSRNHTFLVITNIKDTKLKIYICCAKMHKINENTIKFLHHRNILVEIIKGILMTYSSRLLSAAKQSFRRS